MLLMITSMNYNTFNGWGFFPQLIQYFMSGVGTLHPAFAISLPIKHIFAQNSGMIDVILYIEYMVG